MSPFNVGSIEVIQTGVNSPDVHPHYHGLRPEITVLKQGYQTNPDRAAFAVDTIWELDFEVPMRDGCKLRVDVFRPATSDDPAKRVPVLIAWGPYGKTGKGALSIDIFPGRVGIPKNRTSGLESFEAPDPAEWTARGYAICNIDSRGTFESEGDIRWWGSAEGRDGYDAVEYLATQEWCNGNIGMVGNSWLAISQYFIAAEQPPHLKCIAPLEGASDFYRETLCRGGVANPVFAKAVAAGLFGRSQQEDVGAMIMKYPLWNEYWQDKRARFDRIKVPSYVLASYSTGLHTEGAFRAFEEIKAPKWLRVHPHQEWYDLYQPSTNDELNKFFDKYTKNIDNGWEATPKVRVSVRSTMPNWPITSTQYTTMYLDAEGTLGSSLPNSRDSITYDSNVKYEQRDADAGEFRWEYTFQKTSYMVGSAKATLYMSTDDHDDMSVFVQLRKADSTGKLLQNMNITLHDLGMTAEQVPDMNIFKYLGPTGVIRASHREIDEDLSTPYKPVLAHKQVQKLKKGEIVKLEIAIWATGIAFEPGEKLVLKVGGHELRLPEFEQLRGLFDAQNQGEHRVYCGQDGYSSSLTIPFVEL